MACLYSPRKNVRVSPLDKNSAHHARIRVWELVMRYVDARLYSNAVSYSVHSSPQEREAAHVLWYRAGEAVRESLKELQGTGS